MSFFYIILAAVALGVLVFVHELGHYFVARWLGMSVEVFSIGFGRPLLKWRWQNVNWQLGWLPFGGYVKIAGMEFGKKEGANVDPYEVPQGFFSRSPVQRILVALAGPMANFILAFLIFFSLWLAGGRQKPFSDFTQVVGWVDPQSELFSEGVRPGDLLTTYDGKPFQGSKDLIYAAMLSGQKVELSGYQVNYATGEKIPFRHLINTYPSPASLDGIQTTGVSSLGRYLIYDRLPGNAENPLPEGSPMQNSGITYGDRLVWADGEILFSLEQLNAILNDRRTLLTVQRGGETFLSRQPRIKAGDLLIPTLIRNELMDWQYEAGLRTRWQDLYVIPYNLTADGTVENPIEYIDEEMGKAQAERSNHYGNLEQPLQQGDRIIAIDGVPINTAYQLLDLLQTHHVLLIVKKQEQAPSLISWNKEDGVFLKGFDVNSIQTIASTIGAPQGIKEVGGYRLLNPVEPKRLDQFALSKEAQESLQQEYEHKKKEILAIKDVKKRNASLQVLEQSYRKYILGVPLQDRLVNYNPTPVSLFGHIFAETGYTLKALFTGALNPKWISGPVGIVQVIHYGWKVGLKEALFWIAAISMNLGILNLLPIPVLDGGYICLSLWELITKKRLKARTMERLIIPFVVILIGLLIFLTFQDIKRLF